MDSASRVGAVIVTHHPDLSVLWQLLVSIARQTQEVILVDNGSSAECVEALAKFAGGSPHRHLIAKPDNQGIAAAQNQGIGLSMALGCTHILLLDHDSIPTDTMVEQLLLLERRLLTNNVKVGAVGPTIVDSRTLTRAGFVWRQRLFIRRRHPSRSIRYVETDFLIASGTLIRNAVIREIGAMNNGYFIDHVDTEWCFRATHRGYRLFGARNAVLNHRLGDTVVKVWFGRWREVPRHSPLRNYFIFRNTLKMVRHTPMSITWRIVHLYRLVKFLTFFLIAGKPRILRLNMMLRGIVDGVRGVQGNIVNGKATQRK